MNGVMMRFDVFFCQARKIQIRWVYRRDMAEMLAIEHEASGFPWTEEEFMRYLRQPSCIGIVAERASRIVGFMIRRLLPSHLELAKLAVASDARRQGVGAQMVTAAIDKFLYDKPGGVQVELRETNLAAQLFFRDCGFWATDVLRNHYDNTDEDAYVMRFRFDESEESWVVRGDAFSANTGVDGLAGY
jgi:[ribosomal protein S18]-alanine N-acetyltransferase